MANRHFAKIADIWKHLPLTEILAVERPSFYWETHAGNASYPLVANAERSYGALRFAEVATQSPALAGSKFLAQLRWLNPAAGPLTIYPGSPLLAMRELGDATSYLFCDTDAASVADLEAAASRLGLASRVRAVASDGMTALHEALGDIQGTTIAHVDPYDPWSSGPSGLSALGFAREAIRAGLGLVYWYGYDGPDERAWPLLTLSQGSSSSLWCGDVMVASHGVEASKGDLGDATSPGTGFGVICANVSREAIEACVQLGEALADAYDGVPLPDGTPGHLDFRVSIANGKS